jgi:hypothetical protein
MELFKMFKSAEVFELPSEQVIQAYNTVSVFNQSLAQ